MSRPRACVLVLFLLAGCENSGPLEINATSRAPVPPRVVPYEAIDLGDLGGDPTIPFAVNESLDVAGGATLAEGTPHAFRWQQGALADLGTVAGGTSEAHAINNRGQVAGASGGYLSGRVFLWDHGTMQDLGPGNAFCVIVRGINDQGDVLATVYHDYATVSPVLWRRGVAQDLGGLGSLVDAYAYGWDGAARVVGQAAAFIAGQTAYYHPFLWDNGVMRDLGVLGPAGDSLSCAQQYCSQGLASDVNRLGHAVGWSTDSADQIRGFRWDGAALRDLGVQRGQATWAIAINDHDEIAGEFAPGVYSAELHAFRWSGGVVQELGSLGGNRTGVAAMNEDGTIVGYSETADGATHAFVWQDGEMIDLGLGPSGGEFSSAVGVNERGDVIGVGGMYLGRRYAILWRRETNRHRPPLGPIASTLSPTRQTPPGSSAR